MCRYGRNLKNFATRLLKLIKNYEVGYVKKTELHFTREEIEKALKLRCNSVRMLVWKAALSVSHCGEIRLSDLIFITLQAWMLLPQIPHFERLNTKL